MHAAPRRLASFTTLVLEHKLARIVRAASLEELCGMAFGHLGLGVAYVSVFMYNFGGFVAGLLVISASLVTLLVIQPCSEPLRCVHRASP